MLAIDTDHDPLEILEFPELYRNDKKQFRIIRLVNGMKVILVHDDERDDYLPSAALSVAVGSLSDPSDLHGLARCLGNFLSFLNANLGWWIIYMCLYFSEHILFNCDNEFCRFVGTTDEWLRSYTDSDDTTFRFRATATSFEEALGRFACLFKSPLNMRHVVSNVREQIEGEFQTHKWNYCDEQLLPLLGNFDHPSCNFPYIRTSLNNVDDDTLYQRIEEFKNRHYSAHRMSLCIRMCLPLNTMKVWNVLPFFHLLDLTLN